MISSTSYRNDYNGSGSLATYSFTFPITSTSQLVFLETTAGVTTTKVLTTDYTVAQNQDITTGGSVTRVAGNLPSGTQLTIIRIVTEEQLFSFRNQSTFFPGDYEDAIDLLMMAVIQMQGQLDKCVRFPMAEVPGTCTAILPAKSLRLSKTIKTDSSGNITVA